jgi:hypothetical protein
MAMGVLISPSPTLPAPTMVAGSFVSTTSARLCQPGVAAGGKPCPSIPTLSPDYGASPHVASPKPCRSSTSRSAANVVIITWCWKQVVLSILDKADRKQTVGISLRRSSSRAVAVLSLRIG